MLVANFNDINSVAQTLLKHLDINISIFDILS